MAKYSLTITTDDVDVIRKIADYAAIVTYDTKVDAYDFPLPDRISSDLDWYLEQFLVIADSHYEDKDVEEVISYLERKPAGLRKRLADARALESKSNG